MLIPIPLDATVRASSSEAREPERSSNLSEISERNLSLLLDRIYLSDINVLRRYIFRIKLDYHACFDVTHLVALILIASRLKARYFDTRMLFAE